MTLELGFGLLRCQHQLEMANTNKLTHGSAGMVTIKAKGGAGIANEGCELTPNIGNLNRSCD
jgi:hypothetical protein